MLKNKTFFGMGCFILLVLTSCSMNENPTETRPVPSSSSPPSAMSKSSFAEVTINNYIVNFDGRALEDGNTRFTWTVRGTGTEPALSHFMIQLPDCAGEPLSFLPDNSVSINTNPNTGIYGVEWHLNVEADDISGRQYSLLFPGDVPLGKVYSSVISGNETGVGIIPGPCQGYDISGRVFVDANENGLRDPDEESGIPNVIIELTDSVGNVETEVTDFQGNYSFREMPGTYAIQIPTEGYTDYFNADLALSFNATTVQVLESTVPPDSPHNNFGFSPQSQEIINDLEGGILLSNGQSLKFWKSQFRAAIRNGGGNSVYGGDVLLGFLTEIQGLFLAEPFSFTPGNELQEAFDLLSSNSHQAIDELLAELLATELNQAAGLGLVGQDDLQLVLIAWGEAMVPDHWAQDQNKARPVEDELHIAVELFGLVNTGGGGGIDE